MSIAKRRQQLQRLLYLLRHKQAGTAAQVAKRLNCHASTVQKMIRFLRDGGFLIKYDKSLKKYILLEE